MSEQHSKKWAVDREFAAARIMDRGGIAALERNMAEAIRTVG